MYVLYHSAVKRGNIAASVGPLLLYGYYQLRKGKNFRSRIFILLVSLVGLLFFVTVLLSIAVYFLSRLEDTLDGDASGRGALYSNAYQIWASSSFSLVFFRYYGFDATLKLMRIHAHSDWLELLVDYGVLGVAIYLALFVSLIFQVKRCRTLEDKCVLLAVLYIWFVKSLISMAYFEPWMILLMISLGIAMSHSNSNLFVLQSHPKG
jgi:O-Antigen ligase.